MIRAGHERDGDTTVGMAALDYMHARYYSPASGRFLSVDPVVDIEKALSEPQRWNRYAYVTNNPLRFTDPDGRLQRDETGKLRFQQLGVTIARHPASSTGFQVVAGYLFADDGSKVLAVQNVDYDVRMNTNCHGLTFADGQFTIDNSQANTILKGDGYVTTNQPSVGVVIRAAHIQQLRDALQ